MSKMPALSKKRPMPSPKATMAAKTTAHPGKLVVPDMVRKRVNLG